MTIAITAASGPLGHLVIEKLRAKVPASEVVALAHSAGKAADLGVTVREADYSRPETLGPALAGLDKLLFISAGESGPARLGQHRNVVEAAKQAGRREAHCLHEPLARRHLVPGPCSQPLGHGGND